MDVDKQLISTQINQLEEIGTQSNDNRVMRERHGRPHKMRHQGDPEGRSLLRQGRKVEKEPGILGRAGTKHTGPETGESGIFKDRGNPHGGYKPRARYF